MKTLSRAAALVALVLGLFLSSAPFVAGTADAQNLQQNQNRDNRRLQQDIDDERYERRTGCGPRCKEDIQRERDDCYRLRTDAQRLGQRFYNARCSQLGIR
jgi:hypothetical protein